MRVKKILGIAVLAISVIIGVYLTGGFERGTRYSECIVDAEQANDITRNRSKTESLIEELIFGEETLFYDPSEKTFYYSLIDGDPNAFDPYINIKSTDKDIKAAFIENGITEEKVENNGTITFLAYSDDFFCEYYLKCTTLPLMNIECPEEIPDEIIPMKLMLFDNRIRTAERLVCSEGNIRLRGDSVKAYPKKCFRFSLTMESIGGNNRSNQQSLLGMRQDDDWLLYAAYNDQDKIRNVFSSNLWEYTCAKDNAQGIDFGMEYKYLELFINGRYWGLYALGYPIDEKQVCISKDNTDAVLYKHGLLTTDGRESLLFTKDGKIFGDLSESPDAEMRRQSLLQHYYYDLYLNAKSSETLINGIDLDNAIDFYLFINLVQGVDNVDVLKNFFILLQNDKEYAKAYYAPWDLDLTWGNTYIAAPSANNTQTYAFSEDFNCIVESGYISQLLMNSDPVVWQTLFKKYRSLRNGGWSEDNINRLLDRYKSDIFDSGAYLRDMARWPEGTYADAEDRLSTFRTYVMNRLKETDLYYDHLEAVYDQTQNPFIRRSTQYKGFLERSFLIEINDHDLLLDADYAEFLEYIGVDISAVAEDTRFILANPATGKTEYLSSLYEENGPRETCLGRLSFSKIREGVYDVKVNGVSCCHTSVFSRPEIKMAIIKDIHIYDFNFSKGYTMQKWKSSFEELAFYIEALSDTDYRAVIEIIRPQIWENTEYFNLFEGLGLTKEEIHSNTDFILWNGLERKALALDDFHISGSSRDTWLGSFSVFENEATGQYGAYWDGSECFIASAEQNWNVDIRIALLDPETYERVDMITFSDQMQ